MPTARQPGMDHAIYPYSPMDTRPVLSLPGGKPVAVYIVLQIEHWELRQPAGAYRDPRFRGDFGSYDPDYRAWSMRAYGNRVGLYRILELFDRLKLPVTAAVGAGALEAHPEIASAHDHLGDERRRRIPPHRSVARRDRPSFRAPAARLARAGFRHYPENLENAGRSRF
jgi:hypothetical protein